MTAPYWIDYAGSRWTLIRPRAGARRCGFCGKAFRARAARYRTRTWGPGHDVVEEYHQRCLIGQIDPSIYDIRDGAA